jgi:hypothetical protein
MQTAAQLTARCPLSAAKAVHLTDVGGSRPSFRIHLVSVCPHTIWPLILRFFAKIVVGRRFWRLFLFQSDLLD